jgi:hypothetical protein
MSSSRRTTSVPLAAMARRIESSVTEVPGLAELVERGVVLPASRRLVDVLAAHPPVRLDDPQATARALDEQRSDRA